ncbi:hypothetical protein [Tenacibaculum sediminilitoris]|uniref:hypothetical protein n=1 Tax=Tenacibaculum sediminilitoris TaxID=1820334 RepID=UPI0038B5DB44
MVKASRILGNEQLEFILGYLFEVIRIKWIKKQYLIQMKEIKKSLDLMNDEKLKTDLKY